MFDCSMLKMTFVDDSDYNIIGRQSVMRPRSSEASGQRDRTQQGSETERLRDRATARLTDNETARHTHTRTHRQMPRIPRAIPMGCGGAPGASARRVARCIGRDQGGPCRGGARPLSPWRLSTKTGNWAEAEERRRVDDRQDRDAGDLPRAEAQFAEAQRAGNVRVEQQEP